MAKDPKQFQEELFERQRLENERKFQAGLSAARSADPQVESAQKRYAEKAKANLQRQQELDQAFQVQMEALQIQRNALMADTAACYDQMYGLVSGYQNHAGFEVSSVNNPSAAYDQSFEQYGGEAETDAQRLDRLFNL